MPQHAHDWDASYEFHGATFRECSDRACLAHQQWVCALDRWSDAFETSSPRHREGQRAVDRSAPGDDQGRPPVD